MNIKKLLYPFFFASVFLLCGFYTLAFANNNNFKNDGTNKEFSDSLIIKNCQGAKGIRTNKKVVALTFDDGPHQKYTPEVLAVLKQNNIRATFFVVGKNAERYPDIIKAAYVDGHVIANHSYSHFFLTKLSDDDIEIELTKTSKIVNGMIGKYPMLFRPPYGACSDKTTKIATELGFTTVLWNDMTNDYEVSKTTPEKIADDIVGHVRRGSIIGLHDGGGNREKTVKALLLIVSELKDRGYEFLTIPELLNIGGYRD
jgi:peptidoglycan/xylan/chitin deacetylase (PgdA/CDA1 family)